MKGVYKFFLAIVIAIVMICAIVWVLNELYIFPPFPYSSAMLGYCIGGKPTLADLKAKSDTILTGTAVGHKIVLSGKSPYTQTKIEIDKIILGKTKDKEVIVKWDSAISESESFVKGEKYLLFLPEPDENGVYDGMSTCFSRKHTVTSDDSGKETVPCFAKDIAIRNVKEIDCPGGQAPGGIVEDVTGKKTEFSSSTCKACYVLLEDLIKQIQG